MFFIFVRSLVLPRRPTLLSARVDNLNVCLVGALPLALLLTVDTTRLLICALPVLTGRNLCKRQRKMLAG